MIVDRNENISYTNSNINKADRNHKKKNTEQLLYNKDNFNHICIKESSANSHHSYTKVSQKTNMEEIGIRTNKKLVTHELNNGKEKIVSNNNADKIDSTIYKVGTCASSNLSATKNKYNQMQNECNKKSVTLTHDTSNLKYIDEFKLTDSKISNYNNTMNSCNSAKHNDEYKKSNQKGINSHNQKFNYSTNKNQYKCESSKKIVYEKIYCSNSIKLEDFSKKASNQLALDMEVIYNTITTMNEYHLNRNLNHKDFFSASNNIENFSYDAIYHSNVEKQSSKEVNKNIDIIYKPNNTILPKNCENYQIQVDQTNQQLQTNSAQNISKKAIKRNSNDLKHKLDVKPTNAIDQISTDISPFVLNNEIVPSNLKSQDTSNELNKSNENSQNKNIIVDDDGLKNFTKIAKETNENDQICTIPCGKNEDSKIRTNDKLDGNNYRKNNDVVYDKQNKDHIINKRNKITKIAELAAFDKKNLALNNDNNTQFNVSNDSPFSKLYMEVCKKTDQALDKLSSKNLNNDHIIIYDPDFIHSLSKSIKDDKNIKLLQVRHRINLNSRVFSVKNINATGNDLDEYAHKSKDRNNYSDADLLPQYTDQPTYSNKRNKQGLLTKLMTISGHMPNINFNHNDRMLKKNVNNKYQKSKNDNKLRKNYEHIDMHMPIQENIENKDVIPTVIFPTIDVASSPIETIIRKVKSLLNKISSSNFRKISAQIAGYVLQCDNSEKVQQLISLLFKKAIHEIMAIELYVDLVIFLRALMHKKSLEDSNDSINFHRILLNQCQLEFMEIMNSNWSEEELLNTYGENIEAAAEEREKRKIRVTGYMWFIGELFVHRIINGKCFRGILTMFLTERFGDNEEDVIENVKRKKIGNKTFPARLPTSPIIRLKPHIVLGMAELIGFVGSKCSMYEKTAKVINSVIDRLATLRINGNYENLINYKIDDLLELYAMNWKYKLNDGKAPIDVAGKQSKFPYKEWLKEINDEFGNTKTAESNTTT